MSRWTGAPGRGRSVDGLGDVDELSHDLLSYLYSSFWTLTTGVAGSTRCNIQSQDLSHCVATSRLNLLQHPSQLVATSCLNLLQHPVSTCCNTRLKLLQHPVSTALQDFSIQLNYHVATPCLNPPCCNTSPQPAALQYCLDSCNTPSQPTAL